MNVIKSGSYAGAIIAIATCINFAYEKNAWSSDLDILNNAQQLYILGMEKRMLTRSIMQWTTKPSETAQENQYKQVIVDQLNSDKQDIIVKMRSIKLIK